MGGWFFLISIKGHSMNWYILQTKPNYEAKVIEGMNKRVLEKNLPVGEIYAPEELLTEYKDGKKKERKRKFFSNYLYVNMEYSDEILHAIKGINGVVGFLGDKGKPSIISDIEVENLKKRLSGTAPKPKVIFEIDSNVRITNGSFAEFIGIIKEVDYEKGKAKVEVKIFGRETLVDMELNSLVNVTE